MSLVVDGKVIEVEGLDVESGPALGLTWPVGRARVKERTFLPDLGVVHATGGEGGASRVFATLSNADHGRGYSVHFVIERSGRVVQFLDPARYEAAHVGGLNARSVGIEVANQMFPTGALIGRPKVESIVQVVGPIVGDYPHDFTTRNGVRLYYRRSGRKACMGLLFPQLRALRLLAAALSSSLGIEPRRADLRDYIPIAERANLKGWLGHSNVTLGHGDPSLDSLDLF